MKFWQSCIVFAAAMFVGRSWGSELPDVRHDALTRRPVAAAVCDGGRSLCVVNQRSGTLSLIDLDARVVVGEYKIGESLSDVAALPDGKTLAITDQGKHELLLVRLTDDSVQIVDRIEMPRSPVNVVVSEDGRQLAVAGLWSHRVAVLRRADDEHHSQNEWTIEVVRLPFAPKMQLFVPAAGLADKNVVHTSAASEEDPDSGGWRLIVADAFGGRIAVIDPQLSVLESVRELEAHNIRGMALSSDRTRLLISHQMLNSVARADFEDVHWGSLLQNTLRDLSLATVLNPHAALLDKSRPIRLGQTGNAAADPAGIAMIADRVELEGDRPPMITALAGVDEVAVTLNSSTLRYEVGARPVNVIWDVPRQQAYVVCSFEDSIAVLEGDALDEISHISLGPTLEPTPRDRGERLFFDGRQSHDGWMSCHSCHTDGHTNGGLADTLSDGSYGTPKQIPSLLGTRDANPWAWNGQFRELHGQVNSSFTSSLHGDELSPSEISDVVAFLHSLEPPPSVDAGCESEDDLQQIEAGRTLFMGLGCRDCHVPPLTFSIDATFDVGLSDEAGLTKFNPPSLRGLSQRTAFLHDGRAKSLENVFVEYGHQLSRALRPEELKSLLAFLKSL